MTLITSCLSAEGKVMIEFLTLIGLPLLLCSEICITLITWVVLVLRSRKTWVIEFRGFNISITLSSMSNSDSRKQSLRKGDND